MTAINYYHDIRLILYAVFLYAGVSVTRSFQEVMCRTFFMSRVAIMCGTLFDLLTQGEVIYAMVSHVLLLAGYILRSRRQSRRLRAYVYPAPTFC